MGLPTDDTSAKESSLRHADKFIELRRNQLSDEIDAQLEIIDTLLLAHVLHGGALSDPIRIPLDKDLAYSLLIRGTMCATLILIQRQYYPYK